MKLLWTETSKRDLINIRRYIAYDNSSAANQLIDRIRVKAKNIINTPFAGRVVPEFSRNDLREIIEGNYRVVYLVGEDSLTILTVFESHRLFPFKKL